MRAESLSAAGASAAAPSPGPVRRLLRGLGVVLGWGVVAWVAWDAVRITRAVVGDEGALGALAEPVCWFVLAQLVVVAALFQAPWRRPARRGTIGLLLVAGLVAACCWLALRHRAAWSPWCGAVAAFAVALPWLAVRPRSRALARGLFAAGYVVAAFAGFALGSGYAFYPIPGAPPPAAGDRDGRWRQDLAYLGRELVRLHGDAFHTLAPEEFARRLDRVVAAVPASTDVELQIEVARLVAGVGDAHTGCVPWHGAGYGRMPVDFAWFGDDLHVTLVPGDRLDLAGCRVLSFGGTPVVEVAEHLVPLLSHENEAWFRAKSPAVMARPDVLAALGLVARSDRVALEVESLDGSRRTVVLETVPAGQPLALTRVVTGGPRLEPRDGSFWSVDLPEEDAVYFRYARCDWSFALRGFTRELLGGLDDSDTTRLIIDLRGNGGGTSLPFLWWVVPEIARRPALDRPDRLYVLVDRGTFSSGVGIAAELDEVTAATLVGEPTGGKPDSWGEVRWFELPNSGLRIDYSTTFHEREAGRDRPSVEPDVHVTPTIRDALSQRDPALEWVLADG